MRYLLMLCGDEAAGREAEEMPGCDDWTAEMARRGVLVSAHGLHPASDATTVRVRADEVLLTDGPFAETKEQVGGLVLVDCADLDEALEVAGKHPWAKIGTIEVRPMLGA